MNRRLLSILALSAFVALLGGVAARAEQPEVLPDSYFTVNHTTDGTAEPGRTVKEVLAQEVRFGHTGVWLVFIRLSGNFAPDGYGQAYSPFGAFLTYNDRDGNRSYVPSLHFIYDSRPYPVSSFDTGCGSPRSISIREEEIDHGAYLHKLDTQQPYYLVTIKPAEAAEWEMVFVHKPAWIALGKPCVDDWPNLPDPPPAEAPPPSSVLDGLSSTTPGARSTWTADRPTTAAAVLAALAEQGASAIWHFDPERRGGVSRWIGYAVIDDYTVVPGPVNYPINPGDTLWISG